MNEGFPDEDLIGRVLDGRYEIGEKLGEGGLGAVFRASQVRLDRPVAVKVLLPQYAENQTLRTRFEREARSLGALRHPAIVGVIDYGIDGSAPYLVMELLEGRPLDKAIRAGIPYAEALRIFREVVAAVAFAHDQGVIHRDLKPGNVFLERMPDGSEAARVLDFGLAKFTDDGKAEETALTRAGSIMGTPSYMSPEQASGATADASSDVYSLGILLYELLTGKKPFRGEVSDLFRRHLLEDLPPLAADKSGIPREQALDSLLRKATAKSKHERLQDGRALSKELDAVLAEAPETTEAPRGPSAEGPTRPEPSESGDETATPSPLSKDDWVATSETLAATPEAARAGGAPSAAEEPTLVSPGRRSRRPRAKRGPSVPFDLKAVIGMGALLFLAAVFVVALASGGEGEEDEGDLTATSAAQDRPAAEEPRDAPRPAEPARDEPTARREGQSTGGSTDLLDDLPTELEAIRRAHRPGSVLTRGRRRTLFQWARAHPDDPRAWLLMADLDFQRGARTDALRWYRKAVLSAPEAARDATMKRNVVIMSGHGAVGGRAQQMLREHWGASALPIVDAVLESEELRRDERRRLERLRGSLGAGS